MIKIARLQFNAFGENTYVLIGDNSDCIIVDAGCYTENERKQLVEFISKNELNPIVAINTHAHVDHILGINFVKEHYGIEWWASEKENEILALAQQSAMMYGFNLNETPKIDGGLTDGQKIALGSDTIEVIDTPGHSIGGVCFHIASSKVLVCGDTLFRGSIGRTDLPTGNYDTLMESIVIRLLTLDHDTQVLPGHGESSTLRFEIKENPFISEFILGHNEQCE